MSDGRKDDAGKLRYDLLEPFVEEELVKVLTTGAAKYADNNWQQVPDAKNRYYAALRRHISSWRQGEKDDKEDGLPHLAHALCNIYFLMWFDKKEKDTKEKVDYMSNIAHCYDLDINKNWNVS